MTTYTVHEIRDISLGAVQRKRIDILIPDGLADDEKADLLQQAIGRIVVQSVRSKLTKGPVLIAFAFAWTDQAKIGNSPAVARALYIRDRLPKGVITPPWVAIGRPRTVQALGGTIKMDL